MPDSPIAARGMPAPAAAEGQGKGPRPTLPYASTTTVNASPPLVVTVPRWTRPLHRLARGELLYEVMRWVVTASVRSGAVIFVDLPMMRPRPVGDARRRRAAFFLAILAALGAWAVAVSQRAH